MAREMQWFDLAVKMLIRTPDFKRMCRVAMNKPGMYIYFLTISYGDSNDNVEYKRPLVSLIGSSCIPVSREQ